MLAALLTFASSAPSVYVGALLLLLFSLGYASPVVAAGVAAATNSAARAESSSSTPVAAAAAAAPVYEVDFMPNTFSMYTNCNKIFY